VTEDLNCILGDWDHDPVDDTKNVRKIVGLDGKEKVQVRVRGGLLQWDIEARPDGTRPHGFESLLHYYKHLLETHINKQGSNEGFRLTSAQSMAAEGEMTDYYQRRVVLFQLGEFERARDDALHNLELMDLLKAYVSSERIVMEQERYRPFVIMDRARAEAAICINNGQHAEAIESVDNGITEIEAFYGEHNRNDLIKESQELDILKKLKTKLRDQYNIPLTFEEKLSSLEDTLKNAIENEDYELAARLRDQIRKHNEAHEQQRTSPPQA